MALPSSGDRNPLLYSSLSSKSTTKGGLTKYKVFEEYNHYLRKLRLEFEEKYRKRVDCPFAITDFILTVCLGIGSFGQVILSKLDATKKYYAIKIMSKAKIVKDKQIQHTYNEKCILEAIRFPFCLYMEFSFKDNSNVYFVFPFLAGGDMFTHLRRAKSFKEKDAKFYAAQICLAIEYLHFLDLVFRDLKPENIVMDVTGYVRLVDFGFCKPIMDRTYTLCGTPEYIAPEIILSKGYGKCVDWWSFGIFLFEMIAGHTPFVSKEPMRIYEKITAGKYRFTAEFSSEAKDLIRNILQIDLTRRMATYLHRIRRALLTNIPNYSFNFPSICYLSGVLRFREAKIKIFPIKLDTFSKMKCYAAYCTSIYFECCCLSFHGYGNLRNGVNDIKNHVWFKSIDWQAIHNRKALPPFIPKVKGPNDVTNFDKFEVKTSLHIAENDKYPDEFADF